MQPLNELWRLWHLHLTFNIYLQEKNELFLFIFRNLDKSLRKRYLVQLNVLFTCLIHSLPMFSFYTPWKHQKTKGFLIFSGGCKMGILGWNRLKSMLPSWRNKSADFQSKLIGLFLYYCSFASFLTNILIFYPLKTPENQGFSGVFREYKMGTLRGIGWHELKKCHRI